ncbi:hypothetical protein [Oecophyllibacter saccharovorans]|uniref:hypothetical protein n=1 Tax=Oecophyllibacter saccharovorans TaxID=2558360 RepID=UPI00116E921F|nr:hypothetical protein [Oecophyllibacter saccharovorans]TPW35236.1 hypothetical protein E3203_07205 [Oecophyllibacter saccharovorans]
MPAIRFRTFVILAAACTLCRCASPPLPEDVQPVPISTEAYQGMSCQQLALEALNTGDRLQRLTEQQRNAYYRDGLVNMGHDYETVPDRAGSLARAKGEMIAIGSVQHTKGCPTGQPSNQALKR